MSVFPKGSELKNITQVWEKIKTHLVPPPTTCLSAARLVSHMQVHTGDAAHTVMEGREPQLKSYLNS